MNFQDKVALVTGAASGIGKAVASGWAARGGHALVVDFDALRGDEVVSEIRKRGGGATFIPCDLRNHEQIDAAVDKALSDFGRIDCLHNNGFAPWRGADGHALLGDVSQENWDHVINVGLTSAFRMIQAVLPVMRRQGDGSIVNTASTAALRAEPHVGPYSIAKAGLAHLTRMVATEYGRDGIRCNAVCPGVIETPLIAGAPLPDDFVQGIPLGRLGSPEEIANVILFLASDLASYVNGAVVLADGGRTL